MGVFCSLPGQLRRYVRGREKAMAVHLDVERVAVVPPHEALLSCLIRRKRDESRERTASLHISKVLVSTIQVTIQPINQSTNQHNKPGACAILGKGATSGAVRVLIVFRKTFCQSISEINVVIESPIKDDKKKLSNAGAATHTHGQNGCLHRRHAHHHQSKVKPCCVSSKCKPTRFGPKNTKKWAGRPTACPPANGPPPPNSTTHRFEQVSEIYHVVGHFLVVRQHLGLRSFYRQREHLTVCRMRQVNQPMNETPECVV